MTTEQWLEVHDAAHRVGLRSNVTMMFGHVERPRALGAAPAARARAAAALGRLYRVRPAARSCRWRRRSTCRAARGAGRRSREALLVHAVARLALHPEITNIQASWVKLGPDGVRQALASGVNDLGGTLMNESISRAAGLGVGAGDAARGDGGADPLAPAACRASGRRPTAAPPEEQVRPLVRRGAARGAAEPRRCATPACDVRRSSLRPGGARAGAVATVGWQRLDGGQHAALPVVDDRRACRGLGVLETHARCRALRGRRVEPLRARSPVAARASTAPRRGSTETSTCARGRLVVVLGRRLRRSSAMDASAGRRRRGPSTAAPRGISHVPDEVGARWPPCRSRSRGIALDTRVRLPGLRRRFVPGRHLPISGGRGDRRSRAGDEAAVAAASPTLVPVRSSSPAPDGVERERREPSAREPREPGAGRVRAPSRSPAVAAGPWSPSPWPTSSARARSARARRAAAARRSRRWTPTASPPAREEPVRRPRLRDDERPLARATRARPRASAATRGPARLERRLRAARPATTTCGTPSSRGERRAVAVVAVEQLEHGRPARRARRARAIAGAYRRGRRARRARPRRAHATSASSGSSTSQEKPCCAAVVAEADRHGPSADAVDPAAAAAPAGGVSCRPAAPVDSVGLAGMTRPARSTVPASRVDFDSGCGHGVRGRRSSATRPD